MADVLLGEELGHVRHEAEELLEAAAVGHDEAELVPAPVEVRVDALPRQHEGRLVAVVRGTVVVAVADPLGQS